VNLGKLRSAQLKEYQKKGRREDKEAFSTERWETTPSIQSNRAEHIGDGSEKRQKRVQKSMHFRWDREEKLERESEEEVRRAETKERRSMVEGSIKSAP